MMNKIQICTSRKKLQIFFRCEFIARTLIWNSLRSGSMRWCPVFMGFLGVIFLFQPLQYGCLPHQVVCPSGKAKEWSLEGGNEVCTQARKMVCVGAWQVHLAGLSLAAIHLSVSSPGVWQACCSALLLSALLGEALRWTTASTHSVDGQCPVLWRSFEMGWVAEWEEG